MRGLLGVVLLAILLTACGRGGPAFDPTGFYTGTMSGNGNTIASTALISRSGNGFTGSFTLGSSNTFTGQCATVQDVAGGFDCYVTTSTEVLSYEGSFSGDTWRGQWNYIGPSGGGGGSFTYIKN